MALVNCADCQTEISSRALACPKCGRPHYVPVQPSDKPTEKVTVEDIDMAFFSMVAFMVKWALASIPALFLLYMLYMVVFMFGAALLGGLSGLGRH